MSVTTPESMPSIIELAATYSPVPEGIDIATVLIAEVDKRTLWSSVNRALHQDFAAGSKVSSADMWLEIADIPYQGAQQRYRDGVPIIREQIRERKAFLARADDFRNLLTPALHAAYFNSDEGASLSQIKQIMADVESAGVKYAARELEKREAEAAREAIAPATELARTVTNRNLQLGKRARISTRVAGVMLVGGLFGIGIGIYESQQSSAALVAAQSADPIAAKKLVDKYGIPSLEAVGMEVGMAGIGLYVGNLASKNVGHWDARRRARGLAKRSQA